MMAVIMFVSYLVVIQHAATDNITELLVGQGTPLAFLWIASGLFILALAGSQLACMFGSGMRGGVLSALLWCAASLPLTYLALNAAFESYILKYDHLFSAFQFLLSQDRSHYAGPTELLVRYGIAHVGLLLVIAMSQAPFLGHVVRSRTPPPMKKAPKIKRHHGHVGYSDG
jgi:hypothetical protein